MERHYTDAERSQIAGIYDEIERWGEDARVKRWGKKPTSARMVHEVAVERSIRLGHTGNFWSYFLVLKALQEAGRLIPTPRGAYNKARNKGNKSNSNGKASARENAEAAVESLQAPRKLVGKSRDDGADKLFSFIESDLGAFLRPEDRERAARAAENVVARKIQDLTRELAAKSEMRARLDMYSRVYDRLIARLAHRIDLLRDKGTDPDVTDVTDAAESEAEDYESVAVQEYAAPAVPKINRIARKR